MKKLQILGTGCPERKKLVDNAEPAALVPQARWLLPLAPLTDAIGRLFHLPRGAFVVGRVKL